MNFGKFDVMMLLTMSLAVISMSFVFPAVGLASADTGANEIPSYTLDTQPIDLAGEFPDTPGTPSRGTLSLDSSRDAIYSNNRVWLDGGTSNGTEVLIIPGTSSSDPAQLLVNDWNSGAVTGQERFNITSANDTFAVNNFTYTMTFEVTQFDEPSYSDAYYEIDYTIRDQASSGGSWISRIPVIGGLFDVASATAAVLGWIGSIIWWFFATLIDIASAIIVVLFDTISFLAGLVTWLVSTYAGIVTNAGAPWVSLFVALPGIILSLEFAKLGMIAASLLPTT